MVHHLSRADARRLAVRAQLLAAPRPTDPVAVVEHLTLLQLDPTKAVAPNAELVLWSRLGSAYRSADLRAALDDRRLLEHDGYVRPAAYAALVRDDMQHWPGLGELSPWRERRRAWIEVNDRTRLEILQLLRNDGPLATGELPDTTVQPWASSGWKNNRNVAELLGLMVARGEVAVSGRRGQDRLWDLAERVYPDDPVVPTEEAAVRRAELRLRSLGIARAKQAQNAGEPYDVGPVGEAAVVDGVPGEWRIEAALLDEPFRGRTALISPLDRLVHDRKRMDELFEYDYVLEMYKAAETRIWGYFALPILHGDRLVGKLDVTADHKRGVLRVDAVHADVPFTKAITAGVDREIADLARWLELEEIRT